MYIQNSSLRLLKWKLLVGKIVNKDQLIPKKLLRNRI